MNTHINVSVRFKEENFCYDLRIPVQTTVKELIKMICEALKRPEISKELYRIKVCNKNIILFDTQRINEYPLADGDEIEIF